MDSFLKYIFIFPIQKPLKSYKREEDFIYEVDIRSRETGKSIETIYSGTHDEVWNVFYEWYKKHLHLFEGDYVTYETMEISDKISTQGDDMTIMELLYEDPND